MELLGNIEGVFEILVQYSILFLEIIGVIVLLSTDVKSIIMWIRKKEVFRDKNCHRKAAISKKGKDE